MAQHMEKHEAPSETYERNRALLEGAKEKAISLGIFSRSFLEKLNFHFLADYKKAGDEFESFELIPGDKTEPTERFNETDWDWLNNVPVLSQNMVQRMIGGQNFLPTDTHFMQRIWLDHTNLKELYSFEAVVVHETAHAKSYQYIHPETGENFNESPEFDADRFYSTIQDLTKENSELDEMKSVIDFKQFRFTISDWSEIYAQLYQREFLRRSRPDAEKAVEDFDTMAREVTRNLPEEIKRLSETTGRPLSKNLLYQENHTLSFFIPQAIEKKFPKFENRIKFLEQCGKRQLPKVQATIQ